MDQLIAEDPTHIGPYRLIARLGAGGMGLVYLGRDEAGRTVAVKVVRAEYAGHPEFRRRFAHEVAAAQLVQGSWTAAVLDAEPEAAVPWVATQYILGSNLHTVVKGFGPLPAHSVHTLANRLALALQAVHAARLIHRDLKPSNVLVTVDGPRVIDFGIARAMDSLAGDSLHTRTGMLIGSPGFMSPEQARGLELTPASDVFCLGAVLVYAATGRLLFGATDTGLNAHLFRIAEEEADLTGVPETLVDLVRECLHKAPAERPTPQQVAARTATDRATEWLPSAILAQLGRDAAQLLDYAPATPAEAAGDTPGAQPAHHTPTQTPLIANAPTETARPGPAQRFVPPPGPPPGAGAWVVPPSPAPFQDPESPHPKRWWGLVVIALAQLMVLLQAGAFTMATPGISLYLHVSRYGMSAMVNAYVLAFGGLLLLGGHIADLAGRKRTLIIGLVGFAAASALGGSADDLSTLIWARALQGVSAALLTPAALSLVATGFTDPRERGKAFGIYGAITSGGSALGLVAGGWLHEHLGWRWSLYAAVPVAVVALIGAFTTLHDRRGRTGARLDVLGVLLGCGGLTAVTYGLAQVEPIGWSVPLTVGLLVGATLLLAFLWWQTRTSSPLLSPYILKDRNHAGCYLTIALAGAGVFALFPPLLYYLQSVLLYTPAKTGAAFLPMVAAAVVGSTQVSARLLDRARPRALIVSGLVTTALGLLLLTTLKVDGSYATAVLPGILLTGFGAGVAFMPMFATATAAITPRHSGATSAAIGAAQQVGAAIGAALISHALGLLRYSLSWDGAQADVGMLHTYTVPLWWALGSTLLAGLTASLMITAKAPAGIAPTVNTAA